MEIEKDFNKIDWRNNRPYFIRVQYDKGMDEWHTPGQLKKVSK